MLALSSRLRNPGLQQRRVGCVRVGKVESFAQHLAQLRLLLDSLAIEKIVLVQLSLPTRQLILVRLLLLLLGELFGDPELGGGGGVLSASTCLFCRKLAQHCDSAYQLPYMLMWDRTGTL